MRKNYCIYVLLTDTGTLFTRMIKLFTKAPMNHASIAFDPQLREVYSFGRKRKSNPWVGGFVMEDMTSELFEHASCVIYRVPVARGTYENIRARIREFERNKHQYTYNLLGLFGVLFNLRIRRKRAYFCTQFVASVLQEGGVRLCAKPPELTTPNDLAQAPMLQQLYRGSLRQYKNAVAMTA